MFIGIGPDWIVQWTYQDRLKMTVTDRLAVEPLAVDEGLVVFEEQLDQSPAAAVAMVGAISVEGTMATEGQTAAAATNGATKRQSASHAEMAAAIAAGDGIRAYLNGVGQQKLLTAEEEVDLAKAIEAGLYAEHLLDLGDACDAKYPRAELEGLKVEGEQAKNQMIEANLRLVVTFAKKYQWSGMALLDLVQEGNLGLIRAVEKFDYTKGFKFSTYASDWIRQSLGRAVKDQARTIRIPVHMMEYIDKLRGAQRTLTEVLERPPDIAELAKKLKWSEDRVMEVMAFDALEPISLQTPLDEAGEITLEDALASQPTTPTEPSQRELTMRRDVEIVLATLDEREQRIARLRFGLGDNQPRTLEEVGKEVGLGRERIRQIEKVIMSKLRKPELAEVLAAYLPAEKEPAEAERG